MNKHQNQILECIESGLDISEKHSQEVMSVQCMAESFLGKYRVHGQAVGPQQTEWSIILYWHHNEMM